jgi:uncharacterized membrane protein YcaP (DUF421 family)
MAPLQINWPGRFTPDTSPLEMVLRGTVMYFVLLALLRLVPRRTVGSIGIMDLLVVLVAEAAGKAMGDYDTLSDGIILVATLIGWSYLLNWLTYTVPAIDRLVSPRPLPVVRNGRLLRRNMRAEFLTDDELLRQLRLEGVEGLGAVEAAYFEGDGSLSVTRYNKDARP